MSRVLVINPNSSACVTAAIDRALVKLRWPGGPVIDVVDLPEGPASISSQREADSVIAPLLALASREAADAIVIACFGDPGLHALREAVAPRPVFGIGECGILRALTLGERFGIVALSESSVRRQRRAVRQMGLDARFAGSWPVAASAAATADPANRGRLIEAASRLVGERGADVVVLGCAGMADHRAAIEDAAGVPVIEPTQQAAAMALGAVLLG